jgi:hypothetical protein
MSEPFTSTTQRGEGPPERASTTPADDLRAAAEQTKQAASSAASQVKAEAVAAAETVKQEGAALLETARGRASEMAQEGVQAGAAQASGLARAIHRAADELRDESPQLADTVREAAGALDGMARALRDRSPGDVLRGAEDFARRQPLAFVGVTALAGFAIARFARASTARQETSGGMAGGQRMQHPDHAAHRAGMGGPAAGTVTGPMPGTSGATQAPGWTADQDGQPRPATLASASLGGAAAYRPRGGSENG